MHYQTYSKGMRYFTRDIMLDHGKGSRVWDTEGNEYCDFTCALGPGLTGHNDVRINTAIEKQLKKGISFSTPTQIEQDLCRKLTKIIPGCEACKLMKNGKDVTTAAVKLARAYTGRDIVLKAGYHGWDDWTIGIEPGAKGIPFGTSNLTKKFKYNDIDDLKSWFDGYNGRIAAVILEPVMENGPKNGYLLAIKELCHKNGAVLIFDEVVTGARFALGGAAEYYGVTPDLTCIGKAYGGGMPISAVCGRRDILNLIDTGEAFISTTFGGECLSIAAALAVIEILEQPGTYEHIWSLGQTMLDGLQQAINFYSLNDCISTIGMPPHNGLKFSDIGKLDYLDLLSIYEEKMLNSGIIVSDTGFVSLSHSKDDIDYFVLSAGKAMGDICRAIEQDSTEGILFGRKISPVFKRH
ncbi:MAG: aminotransferase class III-fold pyridoxal phosphate-dependent enzyme [Candidatus Babeliales bacterium]|jgi:glutamate-1-semialdehyde aminotransferase